MTKNEKVEKFEFEELQPKYIGPYVALPQWVYDELLPNREIPTSFLRFFLFLWRKTIGWKKIADSLSARDIQAGAGIPDRSDISRWSHSMAACGFLRYQPGVKGLGKSRYEWGLGINDKQFVVHFLKALAETWAEEKDKDPHTAAPLFAQAVNERYFLATKYLDPYADDDEAAPEYEAAVAFNFEAK